MLRDGIIPTMTVYPVVLRFDERVTDRQVDHWLWKNAVHALPHMKCDDPELEVVLLPGITGACFGSAQNPACRVCQSMREYSRQKAACPTLKRVHARVLVLAKRGDPICHRIPEKVETCRPPSRVKAGDPEPLGEAIGTLRWMYQNMRLEDFIDHETWPQSQDVSVRIANETNGSRETTLLVAFETLDGLSGNDSWRLLMRHGESSERSIQRLSENLQRYGANVGVTLKIETMSADDFYASHPDWFALSI